MDIYKIDKALRVSQFTKNKLKKNKLCTSESYNSVILRLLKGDKQ